MISTYFSVDAYSNSFLSRIKNELLGIPLPENQNPQYFADGKEYEDSLLYHTATKSVIIKAMVKITKAHPTFKALINHPEIKIQHEWYGKLYGLDFKCKADLVIKGNCVPDIKSTSCTTLESFIKSMYQYDYDRQIFIYMKAYKCPMACIIATTKQKKPKVFVVPVFENDYLYNSGELKTRHLISVVKSL